MGASPELVDLLEKFSRGLCCTDCFPVDPSFDPQGVFVGWVDPRKKVYEQIAEKRGRTLLMSPVHRRGLLVRSQTRPAIIRTYGHRSSALADELFRQASC